MGVVAEDLPSEVRFAYAGSPRVWILAKADGSFDKVFGTKVRWIPFASGADVLTLFAAREIDIARFGSSPAAAAITRKLPIEIIGVSGVIATSERLIAREAKGVRSLPPRRYHAAYPPNSTAHYALEAAIKVHKLDKAKIKLVALKPADIVAALEAWRHRRGIRRGPFTQQLEADGGKEIFVTKALQKDGFLIYNNFAVRKEFAEKHPQLLVRFLRTYQDKVDQYKKDPEAAAQIIARHLDVPLDTARSTLAGLEYPSIDEQLTPAFLGSGPDTPNSAIARAARDTALFLADIGELRRDDIPSSFAPFINTTYLQQARRR